MRNEDLARHRCSGMRAYTIFELLAVVFIIAVTMNAYGAITRKYGTWMGIGGGLLAFLASSAIVVLVYYIDGCFQKKRRQVLREKYRRIFRVTDLPDDPNNIKTAAGAEIRIGDYGWEAGPPKQVNGLIFLHGLTNKWRVVWYAGFRPDQLEEIGPKPRSQYDWKYSWLNEPPPCPYTIQDRETFDMGLPLPGVNGPVAE